MPLQTYTFNNLTYTVDYRLKQFRACPGGWENGGPIEFIDFDTTQGDEILSAMIKDDVLDLNKYNP